MFRRLTRSPWLLVGTGFATGLLLGIGMLIGALATQGILARQGVLARQNLEFPSHLLHATATHGSNTMAIATGPIDDNVEGLFVLDFISGDLQCMVLNPRTMQLGGLFKKNVVADLGIEQGKQPKYLIVTGAANVRVTGGNVRPAASIVYVAEANSGRFAAYMLPWNRQAQSYNFAQAYDMQLLGVGSARNLQIE